MDAESERTSKTESVRALKAQAEIDQRLIAQLQGQGVLDRAEIADLKLALVSAREIGAAMGIIMAIHRVTAEDAFTVLRRSSQTTHRKLRDVAEEVLITGVPPVPPGEK